MRYDPRFIPCCICAHLGGSVIVDGACKLRTQMGLDYDSFCRGEEGVLVLHNGDCEVVLSDRISYQRE